MVKSDVKIRRSPATARFARENLEKELTIRFLTDKLFAYRYRLSQLLAIRGSGQRHIMAHHLLSDMNHLCDYMIIHCGPRRNLTFYNNRKGNVK